MVPLHEEFGWSTSIMSLAVSINLLLFGLTAPFAAALMDRFGIRQVVAAALTLVALGAGGSVLFLVPSISLLSQTVREWAANELIPQRRIEICSDPKSTSRSSVAFSADVE